MLFCKDTNIDVLFTNFSMRSFGYGWGVLIIFWIAFHFQFCLASVAALAFSIINKHHVLFMSFEFSPESMRDRTCFWFLSSQDHTIWQPSTPGNMGDITPQRYMLLQGFFSDRVLLTILQLSFLHSGCPRARCYFYFESAVPDHQWVRKVWQLMANRWLPRQGSRDSPYAWATKKKMWEDYRHEFKKNWTALISGGRRPRLQSVWREGGEGTVCHLWLETIRNVPLEPQWLFWRLMFFSSLPTRLKA